VNVSFRPATSSDSEALLRWRNDAEVRQRSFITAPVSAGEHAAWLAQTLGDDRRRLLICEADGVPVGQARIGRSFGEISIALVPEARGRGLGSRLIALLSDWGLLELGLDALIARVKVDNAASLSAFRAAGYRTSAVRDGIVTLNFERSAAPS
jgi:RimJ/RimL family protein N-acetyltransferase